MHSGLHKLHTPSTQAPWEITDATSTYSTQPTTAPSKSGTDLTKQPRDLVITAKHIIPPPYSEVHTEQRSHGLLLAYPSALHYPDSKYVTFCKSATCTDLSDVMLRLDGHTSHRKISCHPLCTYEIEISESTLSHRCDACYLRMNFLLLAWFSPGCFCSPRSQYDKESRI